MVGAALRSFFLRPSPLPALSRPVLALGSAPGSQIPSCAREWALATVNASQVIQSRIPDLTLMGTGVTRSKPVNIEAKSVLTGHSTEHLILVRLDKTFDPSRFRLMLIRYSYARLSILSKAERSDTLAWAVGLPKGKTIWPSNGVTLAFICLKLGAPFVVMSGISLSRSGHAYNSAGREREHVGDDRIALEAAVTRKLPLYTVDQEFSNDSGVPLFRPEQP